MKGIEISNKYYEEYGKPMIRELFSEYENRIAVGIVGRGSECYGFDDELSRDHDFEPGFCMWLTREDEEAIGFPLMRAYSKLPKEFMEVRLSAKSRGGMSKFGVHVIEDFYERLIGMTEPPRSWQEWMYTPESALSLAVNGEVFRDDLGEFTAFRNELKYGMPEDVRRKKIAAHLAFMAQSGQYNYGRCLAHGEAGAAQLALYEFVSHAISVIYELNRVYEPFYKWQFKMMRQLPILSETGMELESLICGNFTTRRVILGTGESATPPFMMTSQAQLSENIEKICAEIIRELKEQKMTALSDDYLENHAYAVMSSITNREIKTLHVMEL